MKEELKKILHLPHHEPHPYKHPRMSIYNRAAQFAPFAALSGYEDAVKETSRITSKKQDLSPEDSAHLNKMLDYLKKHISDHPLITVTYFKQDQYKSGGQYVSCADYLQNINDFEYKLCLSNGIKIPVDDLYTIKLL